MDLDFSEEQQVLREMVRGLCAEHCPLEAVRRMEDDPRGYTAEFWKQLGELGLLGVLIPEVHGGAGQGMIEAAIVHEELGRALAPSPAFVSSVVCATALQRAGSQTQCGEWLPRIATGEALLAPAWLEPQSGFGPRGVQLRAERRGDSWLLSGRKRHIPFAAAATRWLTLARTGEGAADISLLLVDPQAAGLAPVQVKSLAGDAQFDADFEQTRVPAEALVGAENGGWEIWNRVMLDSIIALAATAVGGCDKALEITVQYAKERKQFDKPLGAFQSISHYLADAVTALDGARTLAYEAAWACSQNRDLRRLAPMAKLFACDTFRDTTAMCQQVWGGVGFTREYDIQLYFRRAKQLQITWWDAPYLEERVAAEVLDR